MDKLTRQIATQEAAIAEMEQWVAGMDGDTSVGMEIIEYHWKCRAELIEQRKRERSAQALWNNDQ